MSNPNPGFPRVLVVDDERALWPVYTELFAEEGWACTCWDAPADPAEVAALDAAVVVSDLSFGADRGAGRRFAEALYADPRTTALPVVICSADQVQVELDRAALEAISCSVLVKPFDIDVLIAEVRRCLAEARATVEQPLAR